MLRLSWYTIVCMDRLGSQFEFWSWRRAFAIIGCVALLYFAAGGALLHHHTGGPETCHVCQSLHMPALAATTLILLPQGQQVARQTAPARNASPLDSFALHRASRAPPAA